MLYVCMFIELELYTCSFYRYINLIIDGDKESKLEQTMKYIHIYTNTRALTHKYTYIHTYIHTHTHTHTQTYICDKINDIKLPYLNTTNAEKYNQHPDKPR